MSFEDDYPETHKKIVRDCPLCKLKMPNNHSEALVWLHDYFISKQKVMEGLDKYDNCGGVHTSCPICGLRKWLGLKDARES